MDYFSRKSILNSIFYTDINITHISCTPRDALQEITTNLEDVIATTPRCLEVKRCGGCSCISPEKSCVAIETESRKVKVWAQFISKFNAIISYFIPNIFTI